MPNFHSLSAGRRCTDLDRLGFEFFLHVVNATCFLRCGYSSAALSGNAGVFRLLYYEGRHAGHLGGGAGAGREAPTIRRGLEEVSAVSPLKGIELA